MLSAAEHIQILYEIAMSIGTSLDLHRMLKTSLSAFLGKLNCPIGGIHILEKNQNGEFIFKQILSLPRNTGKIEAYQVVLDNLPVLCNQQDLADYRKNLPIMVQNELGYYSYIMELPNFGLLILIKERECLNPALIKSMAALLSKLAAACTACRQNEEIEKARKQTEIELSAAKQIAENSIKAKEQFLANISHEIRTPLNGILGTIYLLLQTDPTPKQLEYINILKSSGNHLLTIINDILDFSKIEAGIIEFEEKDFSIEKMLEELIRTIQFMADEKNLDLSMSSDDRIPAITIGDPIRLNQVLLNLTENAVKFTEKGHIQLSARLLKEDNEQVKIEFSVIDTGIGIPEDKIHSIFQDFEQVSSDTTRKYGGTGLGLAIVKKLIRLQNGTISVESQINKGSHFRVVLPFKKVPTQDEKNRQIVKIPEDPDVTDLKAAKVLLVEDNDINRLVAESFLKSWKCEVDTAANGKIAIEKLTANPYDIVLMDIQMPEMDGYTASRYIREKMKKPESQIPILALTASAFNDVKEQIKVAGMNDYILKPFNPLELYKKIALFLKRGTLLSSEVTKDITKFSAEPKYTDLSNLRKFFKNDTNFIMEAIELFLQQTPQEMNKAIDFCANRDWEGLYEVIHKMKSSIGFMKIGAAQGIIQSIEEYCKEETNPELMTDLLSRMSSILEKACRELKNELSKLS